MLKLIDRYLDSIENDISGFSLVHGLIGIPIVFSIGMTIIIFQSIKNWHHRSI